MKFLLLWLCSLVLAFVAAQETDPLFPCGDYSCPKPKDLIDATCSGFKVRKASMWDDFAVFVNDTGEELCVLAEDGGFNTNFLCCAETEDGCCEDYPTGFFVGFVIGIGGIGLMVLYAVYLCFGSKSAPKVVEE